MNKKLLAAVLPLGFAVVASFIAYNNLKLVLLSTLALVAVELWLWRSFTRGLKTTKQRLAALLPFGLVVVGSIGISASAIITREKLELIQNPEHVTSCSVSPIVACSPVIASPQASVFADLPNPIIGIFGYGALIIAGFSLLAGGIFVAWWWRVLWVCTALAFGFVLWLIYQTLYVIGALCIYCMVAWAVTIPAFIYISLQLYLAGQLKLPKKLGSLLERNHVNCVVLLYAVIAALIYFRFDYYWNSLI